MSVFMMTVLFLSFDAVGATSHNEEELNLLCGVFAASERVLDSYRGNGALEEAIYGTRDRAKFDEHGNVHLSWACGEKNLRTQLCTHYKGSRGWEGCFAESLFGTFLCLCTPGIGHAKNVCGISGVGTDDGWWGQWKGELGQKALIAKVWKNLKQKCLEKSVNGQMGKSKLDALKNSMEDVRKRLKESSGFFYLGGSGNRSCTGTDLESVCAAYKGNRERTTTPWADKIEEALKKIEADAPRPIFTPKQGTAETNKENQPQMVPQRVEVIVAQNKSTKEETNVKNGDEEQETHIAESPRNLGGKPQRGTKGSTQNSTLTYIPHLATEVNVDGSLITKPLRLLLAVLLH